MLDKFIIKTEKIEEYPKNRWMKINDSDFLFYVDNFR